MTDAGIRRARLADCDSMAAIHAESFPTPWTPVDFAGLLAQVGIAGWIADDPPRALLLVRAAADEAEILTLAVVPAARRRGLAADLMQTAMDMLMKGPTRRLLLEVAEDNVAARALYMGFGFTPCGRRAAYYAQSPAGAPATDALIMARDLY
jgi:ribosomal-protein-alanine N-acetyltransferase